MGGLIHFHSIVNPKQLYIERKSLTAILVGIYFSIFLELL